MQFLENLGLKYIFEKFESSSVILLDLESLGIKRLVPTPLCCDVIGPSVGWGLVGQDIYIYPLSLLQDKSFNIEKKNNKFKYPSLFRYTNMQQLNLLLLV